MKNHCLFVVLRKEKKSKREEEKEKEREKTVRLIYIKRQEKKSLCNNLQHVGSR